MDTVFARAAQELEKSHDIMLVTVVGSAGSAPRKAGSCMIVGAEGRLVGTIGGGSIEYQSEIKARELLEQKATLLYPFVLNETATDGLGMMCGGTADVWFQYISAENAAWRATIQATTQALASNKGGWLVLSLSGAEPCLLSTQKELLAAGDETLAAELLAGLGETLEECRARQRRENRVQKKNSATSK